MSPIRMGAGGGLRRRSPTGNHARRHSRRAARQIAPRFAAVPSLLELNYAVDEFFIAVQKERCRRVARAKRVTPSRRCLKRKRREKTSASAETRAHPSRRPSLRQRCFIISALSPRRSPFSKLYGVERQWKKRAWMRSRTRREEGELGRVQSKIGSTIGRRSAGFAGSKNDHTCSKILSWADRVRDQAAVSLSTPHSALLGLAIFSHRQRQAHRSRKADPVFPKSWHPFSA